MLNYVNMGVKRRVGIQGMLSFSFKELKYKLSISKKFFYIFWNFLFAIICCKRQVFRMSSRAVVSVILFHGENYRANSESFSF